MGLATVALLLAYGGHAFLRSGPFADRAAATLGDPAVQDELANRLTDAVIARAEDLTAGATAHPHGRRSHHRRDALGRHHPLLRPSLAAQVNADAVLLRRAQACRRLRDRLPNLVAVDLYRRGDVLGVVDALNGIAASPG